MAWRSGGATGPGGFATLHLMDERQDPAAPDRIMLTAQGATDGACCGLDTSQAPKIVDEAIRPIVTSRVLRLKG